MVNIMENLGLFSSSEISQIVGINEYIDYLEGNLLDNFIFYNNQTRQYMLCLEHILNEWSSCYEVFAQDGNGIEIFTMWDRFVEDFQYI